MINAEFYWRLFEQTGSVLIYLLYREMSLH